MGGDTTSIKNYSTDVLYLGLRLAPEWLYSCISISNKLSHSHNNYTANIDVV